MELMDWRLVGDLIHPFLNKLEPKDWMTGVGQVLTVATILFGVKQYRKNQEWKRAEFAAAQAKELDEEPTVKDVYTMLDYNRYGVELFPDADEIEHRFVEVTDDLLARALVPHPNRVSSTILVPGPIEGEMIERQMATFTPEEGAIRKAFDVYLDGLERFEHYIASGLLSPREVKPYLSYYLSILADQGPGEGRKPLSVRLALRDYITFYYPDVLKLFARFGWPLPPAG